MFYIPDRDVDLGSDRHYPHNRPVRRVALGSFDIDLFPVTNTRFAETLGPVSPRSRMSTAT